MIGSKVWWFVLGAPKQRFGVVIDKYRHGDEDYYLVRVKGGVAHVACRSITKVE